MKHNGIADPRQLAMLEKVLNDYCARSGISKGSRERELIAATIISLYENGISDEETLAASLPAPGTKERRFRELSDQLFVMPADGALTSTSTTTVKR